MWSAWPYFLKNDYWGSEIIIHSELFMWVSYPFNKYGCIKWHNDVIFIHPPLKNDLQPSETYDGWMQGTTQTIITLDLLKETLVKFPMAWWISVGKSTQPSQNIDKHGTIAIAIVISNTISHYIQLYPIISNYIPLYPIISHYTHSHEKNIMKKTLTNCKSNTFSWMNFPAN